jgi:PIN domain nuclease of toxin-antitoxin system
VSSFVLDASALLALIQEEPGGIVVAEAIDAGAVAGTVNLCEVVAKLLDGGWTPALIQETLHSMEIETVDFTGELAYSAGLLRSATRRAGLSLADRACLALAASLDLPAMTADRSWAGLDLGVRVVLCR